MTLSLQLTFSLSDERFTKLLPISSVAVLFSVMLKIRTLVLKRKVRENWFYKLFCLASCSRCWRPFWEQEAVSCPVISQCLAFWFSYQAKSWIFETSCQYLGNYSSRDMQDFARFFQMVKTIQEIKIFARQKIEDLGKKTKRLSFGMIDVLLLSTFERSLRWRQPFTHGFVSSFISQK